MRKLSHEEIKRPSTDAVHLLPRHPVTVLLDNVRSVHNVGSIFRTSDGALVERIILTGITPTPENPQMHKTALGAQDTVPWNYEPDATVAITNLRNQNYTIVVLEITDTPLSMHEFSWNCFPLCLIVGNEISGVSESIINQADCAFEIPQYGVKHSLNVAVACGIAIFDFVKILRGTATTLHDGQST